MKRIIKPRIIQAIVWLNILGFSASVTAEEGQFSIGLQYHKVENYFNQVPSTGYGEEAITAVGVKLEAIKPLSTSKNVDVFYGAGIGLSTGSYQVETEGPTNGAGNLSLGAGLNLFVEGQFHTSKNLQLVVRGGYAVNLYSLSAADYSSSVPLFNPYDESVDEGSTEFFAAFGVKLNVDKEHPIKILYRVTLGDLQSAWTDTSYANSGTAVAHTYTLSGFEVSYGF